MANRKKRLAKGIKSLNKQIAFHEQKRNSAISSRQTELADYYEKEINTFKNSRKRKRNN